MILMNAKDIVAQMSLEEKASLTVGPDFWHFEKIERLGLPSILVTDGPHGIRKQKIIGETMGSGESVEATCFPPACLSASGWDTEALETEGDAIGAEAASEGVSIVLGPGINIKRSPLCGRNFEYFSEDPFLAGSMAASWIKGVQKRGIGTSLKHFAANSQEKKRLISNSVVDERALREIYLSGFEKAVRESQPWTLMCSYNKINGTYSSDNRWLLSDVLRKEWGFNGIVITDWGAMNDRVEGIKAGLDIEMPGPDESNVEAVVRAVREKRLHENVLDEAAERIVSIILKAMERKKSSSYDRREHHEIARKIASHSFVLLKNEGSLLPLSKDKSYAVLGQFAKFPRIQGNGSSQINSNYVDLPFDELIKAGYDAEYAPGYSLEGTEDNEALISEAVALAGKKDAVIVFAGLTKESESEGFDRTTLGLPSCHDRLIEEVAKVNASVIVVLYGGSPFLMPWLGSVKSVIMGYLPGDAAGEATVDVLSGAVNPSGKLAETFPLSLEDTPCYGNYAIDDIDVLYKESILVGYRYYDYMKKDVLFPFGFGLSYTSFSYEDMSVDFSDDKKEGVVSVKVRNTGNYDGSEVVEIYVEKLESAIFRPLRELKGFSKVFLKKGEEKTVSIPLSFSSFAYYSVPLGRFDIEDGIYRIYASSSSRDHRLHVDIQVSGNKMPEVMPWRIGDDFSLLFPCGLPLSPSREKLSLNSTLSEVLRDEKASLVFRPLRDAFITPFEGKSDGMSRMQLAMASDMPLRSAAVLTGAMSLDEVREKLVALEEEKA